MVAAGQVAELHPCNRYSPSSSWRRDHLIGVRRGKCGGGGYARATSTVKPSIEDGVNDYKLLRTLLLVGIIASLVAKQLLVAVLIYGVAAVFYYTKGGGGYIKES